MRRMNTILICHHDPAYLSLLSDYMRQNGYRVETTMDAEQVYALLSERQVQLVLIDAKLHGGICMDVVRRMRGLYAHLPIVVLSPVLSREEQLYAYRCGCSDYVGVPADMELLLARMEALIRLVAADEEDDLPAEFMLGHLHFDGVHHQLGEKEISPRESALLLMLCRHKNKVVLRSQILQTIWARDDIYASRSLSVYINRLRHYLEPVQQVRIVPVRGKGYQLMERI